MPTKEHLLFLESRCAGGLAALSRLAVGLLPLGRAVPAKAGMGLQEADLTAQVSSMLQDKSVRLPA